MMPWEQLTQQSVAFAAMVRNRRKVKGRHVRTKVPVVNTRALSLEAQLSEARRKSRRWAAPKETDGGH